GKDGNGEIDAKIQDNDQIDQGRCTRQASSQGSSKAESRNETGEEGCGKGCREIEAGSGSEVEGQGRQQEGARAEEARGDKQGEETGGTSQGRQGPCARQQGGCAQGRCEEAPGESRRAVESRQGQQAGSHFPQENQVIRD